MSKSAKRASATSIAAALTAPRPFPLIDRITPATLLGDTDLRRRVRLLVAFVAAVAVSSLIFAAVLLAGGQRTLAFLSLLGLASNTGSIVLLRRFRRVDVPGIWHTFSCAGIVAALSWQSGLTLSPLAWFLTIFPSIGLVLVGLWTTWLLAALCSALLIGFAIATPAGSAGAGLPLGAILLCQLVLLGFSLVVAALFELTKTQALAERDETNTRLADEVEERRRAEVRLVELHGQLVKAARQAGMAEIATGALHNVGNALNSVGTAASLIRDEASKLRVDSLRKLSGLLRRDAAPTKSVRSSPQTAVFDYVDKLYEHMAAGRTRLENEARELLRFVEHTQHIIATQQTHASSKTLVEELDLEELVEDALRLEEASLSKHGIAIERRRDGPCSIRSDRHRILEILVNLVRNAKYAVADRPPERKRIGVSVRTSDPDRIQIRVSDEGRGMDEATLARAFEHGFTTRAEGNGFGLHASALAACEMGGSLSGYSAGDDQGATFVLDLPAAPPGDSARPAAEGAPC